MADIEILKAEIQGDPEGLGYVAMTDQEAADSLNAVTGAWKRDRPQLTGDQVFGATDTTEFNGLSDAKRQLWMAFCGRDYIDPFGAANVAFVQWCMGAGATLTALQAARQESISRGVFIGYGPVRAGDVAKARP